MIIILIIIINNNNNNNNNNDIVIINNTGVVKLLRVALRVNVTFLRIRFIIKKNKI